MLQRMDLSNTVYMAVTSRLAFQPAALAPLSLTQHAPAANFIPAMFHTTNLPEKGSLFKQGRHYIPKSWQYAEFALIT
jgi:hypothetical protein